MSDAGIVRALLGAAIRDPWTDSLRIVDGGLFVESIDVDLPGLLAHLKPLDRAHGWAMTTDAVSRVAGGGIEAVLQGHRLLSADLHRAEDDVTTTIRSEGARYRIRTIRPGPGAGLLVKRRLIAIDGGWIAYQTAWEPVDGRLVVGITRFVGFEGNDGEDRR